MNKIQTNMNIQQSTKSIKNQSISKSKQEKKHQRSIKQT